MGWPAIFPNQMKPVPSFFMMFGFFKISTLPRDWPPRTTGLLQCRARDNAGGRRRRRTHCRTIGCCSSSRRGPYSPCRSSLLQESSFQDQSTSRTMARLTSLGNSAISLVLNCLSCSIKDFTSIFGTIDMAILTGSPSGESTGSIP